MSDKPIKKLPIIRTKEQLSMILNGLSAQGFGSIASDWQAHDYKVYRLISENNVFGVSEQNFKSELIKLVQNMTNYSEIERIIKNYFKKFKPDDKIKELISKFYLKSDMSVRQPSRSRPEKSDIKDWIKLKKKYKIKGEPKFNWTVDVYNLDKSFIKVNFFGYNWENQTKFSELYEFMFGEKPDEWSSKLTGSWQNLGKIEVKIFQNSSMNIKGEVKKLKKYLYEQLGDNCIIIYNKNKEIREYKY